MATFREDVLDRGLHALLRRRGAPSTPQEVRRVRRLIRFAAVFVGTILFPALLLAWFALASIRSEELSLDADLRARAAAIEGQVFEELSSVFSRFEEQTRLRVDGGGSPLDRLGELSPFLRVAFRVDAQGQPVAPFSPAETRAPPVEPAAFRRPWRAGVIAETRGDLAAAAEAYGAAERATEHPTLRAEAAFARARCLARAGRDGQRVLSDVYADHAAERDRQGFRVGDLVVLEQARSRVADDPETAATTLQELITEILNRRWPFGVSPPAAGPGEPTLALAALDALPPTTDPDWLARSRNRLNERVEQLRWAERVAAELDLFAGEIAAKTPAGRVTYVSGPNSPTLWASARLVGDAYMFAFDLDALLEHLRATAGRSTAGDPDLAARLDPTGDLAAGDPVVQRALGPYVSHFTLTVHHQDPASLESQKANRRLTRVLVVLLSVFLVLFGVLTTARIVGRELETARIKADFAANVSHELRSPITHIRLKAESLQLDLTTDDRDRREHYDAIVRESERLSRLVDNVLDFASIERGAKRYQLRPDDLAGVVRSAVEAARTSFEAGETRIELALPPDPIPPVWMDRDALGQVLTNLLSNALKYGADGRWVGVSVARGEDAVSVAVADRGIGIRPEELGQVFDDFFRSTDPKVRRSKGTGIGLSIVRYIVEAHGGSVSVESEVGEGTTFTVTLPLEPPDGARGALPHAAHPVR